MPVFLAIHPLFCPGITAPCLGLVCPIGATVPPDTYLIIYSINISPSGKEEGTTPDVPDQRGVRCKCKRRLTGAIHVPRRAADICQGIRRIQQEWDSSHCEILELDVRSQEEWNHRSRDIWQVLLS